MIHCLIDPLQQFPKLFYKTAVLDVVMGARDKAYFLARTCSFGSLLQTRHNLRCSVSALLEDPIYVPRSNCIGHSVWGALPAAWKFNKRTPPCSMLTLLMSWVRV